MHHIMAGLFSYYKPNFQNSEEKQSRKKKCLEISGRKEFTPWCQYHQGWAKLGEWYSTSGQIVQRLHWEALSSLKLM